MLAAKTFFCNEVLMFLECFVGVRFSVFSFGSENAS